MVGFPVGPEKACRAAGCIEAPPRSPVAHLWFVTIHPFEDGNGRIARAMADMLLARSEQSVQRFYSMMRDARAEKPNLGLTDHFANLKWKRLPTSKPDPFTPEERNIILSHF